MRRKWLLLLLPLVVAALVGSIAIPLQGVEKETKEEAPKQVLITNVSVWDGTGDKLKNGVDVLVEGNKIKQVAANINAPGAAVIDGKGGTLTPGLIDMHQHLMLNGGTQAGRDDWDAYVQGAHASRAAEYLLRQGFTTIRDIAGNSLGIKKAVNSGILPGPRIYSSGAGLSPTGGHGDWGAWNDGPHTQDYQELVQNSIVVDGQAEVLKAARTNFRRGADFIKVFAGGSALWTPYGGSCPPSGQHLASH